MGCLGVMNRLKWPVSLILGLLTWLVFLIPFICSDIVEIRRAWSNDHPLLAIPQITNQPILLCHVKML
jgi:hypothetical protein